MLEKDLRPYLKDCLETIRAEYYSSPLQGLLRSLRGRIVIPTGGGKTAVEAIFLRDMINKDGNDIHIVLAPRIALLNQLIRDYRECAGQQYLAVAFHSGKTEPDYGKGKIKWAEKAVMSVEDIKSEFARAKRMDKDLVVFSTYHSVNRLLDLEFDTLIADESQYCVAENWHETVKSINAHVKLFFTATEKWTYNSNGRGLNNESVFGKRLYEILPQDLIDKGYIVPPRLHVIYGNTSTNKNPIIDECVRIAKYQNKHTTKTLPFSKILFAMNGTKDVITVSQNVQAFKKVLPNHKIFTIISNSKFGAQVDGVRMPRGQFMKELRECDNALVFHYDILSEGIDIDGFTGVAIMRQMTMSKLLQTIGRALRIYKANPNLKKEAIITCSVLNGDEENKNWIKYVLGILRSGGFDITKEDVVINGTGSGLDDEDDIDSWDSGNNVKKAKALLSNVFHEMEDEEEMLRKQAQLNELDDLSDDELLDKIQEAVHA